METERNHVKIYFLTKSHIETRWHRVNFPFSFPPKTRNYLGNDTTNNHRKDWKVEGRKQTGWGPQDSRSNTAVDFKGVLHLLYFTDCARRSLGQNRLQARTKKQANKWRMPTFSGGESTKWDLLAGTQENLFPCLNQWQWWVHFTCWVSACRVQNGQPTSTNRGFLTRVSWWWCWVLYRWPFPWLRPARWDENTG